MSTETPKALVDQAEAVKYEASSNIASKVDYFEEEVKRHKKKKLPMGGLPKSLNAFVEWEVEGLEPVNRSTIYQSHNRHFKNRIEKLCKEVKSPKIPSSVEEAYKSEIKELEKQLSTLAGVNLELHAKVTDLTEQIASVVEDRDAEIKRLKGIVNQSGSLRSI
ncbi:hypothetical protein NO559_11855 [Dasania sp. GY-MA-18]|uniref:Uncharacterized protein n=1 Tax=Dasania phycosphaerae TaxID=2950436 RepID=A0A9J6RNL4_9GAMM|nr:MULTISPECIES: hypothetical protein [Dasania]MCR8923472.1 hypothetical protein [Dasania sp. GY-MA-18]MCZ0865905.1 hypothetical protein [Dasania phycosphaerae]MCZ0869629.1 hypothetical protein [Dasania phycosphaerae]